MKVMQQDTGGWLLLVSTLLCANMLVVGAQFCPTPETILPCTCIAVEGEIQVWCSFTPLKDFIEALKNLATTIQFPISEMILESNNLPSLPGKTFEGVTVNRLMLRDNGLERVTSNWLATLEESLLELFVVEPRLRTLPEDTFDHLQKIEAVTLQGGLMKRSPKFSSLRNLRYLQIYSPVLTELLHENFENLPSLEQLHVIGSPLLNKLDAKIVKNLHKLHLLNVSNCGLTWIHPRAFVDLPNLREIDLSKNRLLDASIVGRACKGLVNLQVLSLEGNFIDRLSDNTFVDLPSLRELYLSGNMISEIQKGAFRNMPSLKTLDLSKNSLKRINPYSFSYPSGSFLEELWLSDNHLFSVNDLRLLFVSLNRLKFLDLSRNFLEQIPFDSSKGHPTLEILNLNENRLKRIPRKAFSGMASLRELRLRNNSFFDFSEGPYWNLPSLKGLDLSQNQIMRLDSALLTYLPSLRRLDLSENAIDTVLPDSFIRNLELETINLSKNFITTFHGITFSYLSRLYEIDVSWNRLREVIPGLPKNVEYLRLNKNQIYQLPDELDLPALRLLDLSSNSLRVIRKNTFRTMKRLQWLYLNDNSLDEVEMSAMNDLTKLELLNIRNNRLRRIDNNWLQNSKDLRELNVQGNLLENLSPEFLQNNPNLKILQLSNNKISNLHSSAFANLRQLEELNLSHNSLGFFPEAFQNLNDLKYLDLSHNSIRTLQPFTLQSLPSLRELRMGNNKLSEVPSNTFKDLVNLEFLDLNENEVEIISSGAFQSLPNLIAIRLSKNKLLKLHEETFVDLPLLQSVELQLNRIFEIPENAFVNIPHLAYLNLSFNEITSLEKSGIRELRSLEVLDLSHNKAVWIEGRSFYDMEWLVELKMDNNLICNIRGAPFNHLSRLRVLSLRNNRMTTVTEFAFQKLRNNDAILELDGNPLSCSCKMLWLLSWLEDTQSEGPRCADGTLFRDARLSRTECGHSRILEPVLPGCESDTLQSSVIESSQLSALTAHLKNSTQGLQPHETDYFYDEYVEYQYEEVNSTDDPSANPLSTPSTPTTSTEKSYHFTTGDTPTLYARPSPPKFNLTNPGLGLDDVKKAQQQPYSGLTFFGIPLPSLSFGNLWKGNSGRSVDHSQRRVPFTIGKVQPVSKKFDGKTTTFENIFTPQTEGGFTPFLPNNQGVPSVGINTDTHHPTSSQTVQAIVNPVQTNIAKNNISDIITEQTRISFAETSSEPYVTKFHLDTEVNVPFENFSTSDERTHLPWPKHSDEKSKFTRSDIEYPSWYQQDFVTTETVTSKDLYKSEPQELNKYNWYFENYNKTNLEPYIGFNNGCGIDVTNWKVIVLVTNYLYWTGRPLRFD